MPLPPLLLRAETLTLLYLVASDGEENDGVTISMGFDGLHDCFSPSPRDSRSDPLVLLLLLPPERLFCDSSIAG